MALVDGALIMMAQPKGWTLVVIDKGGAFTNSFLRMFDAVIWNNIGGDVLTPSQRRAFRDYRQNGVGLFVIHGSAGNQGYSGDGDVDVLLGSLFLAHTIITLDESEFGHRPKLHKEPVYIQILEQRNGWAAGLNGLVCWSLR